MEKCMSSGVLRKYKSLPVGVLVPYDRNARTHSPEQVNQLMASISEFGFTNPLLVDEKNRVIAGHGRLLAMQAMGATHVPCIVVDGLTDPQRRALVLADNQLASNAGWDIDMLAQELRDLRVDGFDIDLLGFDTAFVHELLDPATLPGNPDDVPNVPEIPTSRIGDAWTLGNHRVVCGDSLLPATYALLLGEALVDLCWTDPPYNVAYKAGGHKAIENDSMSDSAFRLFLGSAFGEAHRVMKPGAPIYVAHSDTEGLNFRLAFASAGFHLSGCIIWRKESLVLGRSDYQWIHEPILYGWKKGAAHRWFGGRKNTTVMDLGDALPITDNGDGTVSIRVGDQLLVVTGEATVTELIPSMINEPKPKRSSEHPTMKPTALIERMLKHSGRIGDVVLDPFGGSGSTLIACDRMGMSARLIELDPCYVDVIVRRWQQFTGQFAVRDDGVRFDDV